MTAHWVSIDKVTPEPKSHGLSEKSVVAIYNFIKYPEDYVDPLESIELWTGSFENSFGIEQGARRYISHKKDHYVHENEIHSYNRD